MIFLCVLSDLDEEPKMSTYNGLIIDFSYWLLNFLGILFIPQTLDTPLIVSHWGYRPNLHSVENIVAEVTLYNDIEMSKNGPKFVKNCPKFAKNCQKFPKIAKNCPKFLKIDKNYPKLKGYLRNYIFHIVIGSFIMLCNYLVTLALNSILLQFDICRIMLPVGQVVAFFSASISARFQLNQFPRKMTISIRIRMSGFDLDFVYRN